MIAVLDSVQPSPRLDRNGCCGNRALCVALKLVCCTTRDMYRPHMYMFWHGSLIRLRVQVQGGLLPNPKQM